MAKYPQARIKKTNKQTDRQLKKDTQQLNAMHGSELESGPRKSKSLKRTLFGQLTKFEYKL